ncbi:unnamed protein product, partial [Staurois parvus]
SGKNSLTLVISGKNVPLHWVISGKNSPYIVGQWVECPLHWDQNWEEFSLHW